MIVAIGALLFIAVAFVVLELCARAEQRCDVPEEPWVSWDGDVPEEFDGRSVPTRRVLAQKVIIPENWNGRVDWDAKAADR